MWNGLLARCGSKQHNPTDSAAHSIFGTQIGLAGCDHEHAGQVTRFYADCIRRDADGNLVKKSDGAGTVMIVNGLYEEVGGVATSYYLFGNQRVAMRVAGAVYWLHGDHLGSASLTTNAGGQKVAELRYLLSDFIENAEGDITQNAEGVFTQSAEGVLTQKAEG